MTYLVADDLPTSPSGQRFRELLARPGILRMPGAHNGQAGLQAKSAGFDIKVLRQLIRIRKQEAAEVEEQETMLDIYRRALGM